MKTKCPLWLLALAIQALLAGGCATQAVWQEGQFSCVHEPVQPVKVRLFHSPENHDVLVEYLEGREKDDFTRVRAYWLEQSLARVQERRRPRFVSLAKEIGLEPIPIVESPTGAVTPSAEGFYAVMSTNGYSFTMFHDGKKVDNYLLPHYVDAMGRTKQVLLTPPAVVADATIVGGIVFLLCKTGSPSPSLYVPYRPSE